MTGGVRVLVLDEDELPAAYGLFAATLLVRTGPAASWPAARALYVPGRTLGVREGGELVATAAAFPSRLAVPGGADLPMAAVTRVGVRADRTRRGLLTAMLGELLRDAARRGEVVATLRASQSRIYGRFGFGVATRGRGVRVRRGAGWRADAPAGGAVRLVARDGAIDVLAAVHDRVALGRPGGMTRSRGWWESTLRRVLADDPPLLVAVHTGPDGDDGFAVAVTRGPREHFERAVLAVEDLHAADTAGTRALWGFLLGVDLVATVEARLRPLDEPLELLLAERRDCAVTSTGDETWLRILDVPAALAAPAALPSVGEPVRLGVHDPLLPGNTGVYLLGDGPARRTDAAPDLECDVAALAMAYLGDTAPSVLAAAGWWRVHDPAAPARADRLFRTGAPPWCGTFF